MAIWMDILNVRYLCKLSQETNSTLFVFPSANRMWCGIQNAVLCMSVHVHALHLSLCQYYGIFFTYRSSNFSQSVICLLYQWMVWIFKWMFHIFHTWIKWKAWMLPLYFEIHWFTDYTIFTHSVSALYEMLSELGTITQTSHNSLSKSYHLFISNQSLWIINICKNTMYTKRMYIWSHKSCIKQISAIICAIPVNLWKFTVPSEA